MFDIPSKESYFHISHLRGREGREGHTKQTATWESSFNYVHVRNKKYKKKRKGIKKQEIE